MNTNDTAENKKVACATLHARHVLENVCVAEKPAGQSTLLEVGGNNNLDKLQLSM